MTRFFELLTGLGNKAKNAVFSSINTSNKPEITPLQMNNDGSIDRAASLALKNKTMPLTLGERLTGRTLTEDYQQTDPKTGETELETISNYRPGLLNDIAGGYKENRSTPASLSNFGQNTLDGGRKKGFAYRMGEGLGSLARFGESPLGRSLLVGGIIGASGGSGLEALTYGGMTGLLNQQNRTADRIYRDDLIQSQQNALKNSPEFAVLSPEEQQVQLQNIADNIYSQRGYMNKDIYSNLINTQQMRDNADWKKFYFDTQQENNKINRELQERQLQNSIVQANANRALQYYNANLGHQDRIAALQAQNSKKSVDYTTPRTILSNITEAWKNTPQGKAWKGTSKGKGLQTGLNDLMGISNNDVMAFKALKDSMVSPLARAISQEKGNLSDGDIKRAAAMLPNQFDSYEQGMAKINAITKLLDDLEGNNTSNYNQAINTQSNTNMTKQRSNYKEGQTATNPKTGERLIYRGGKWQKL